MKGFQLFFWRLSILVRAVLLTTYISWFHRRGCGAVRNLARYQSRASDKVRGRYIWRVARRFWAQPIINLTRARVEVIGREHLDDARAYIVAANHESAFDIPLAVGIVEGGRFIVKREISRLPVFGKAALHGGQIIVDRANNAQAVAAIHAGIKVWPNARLVIFVEGTRTRTGEMGPFKKGAFHIALDTKLPIIPMAISGAFRVLPPNSIMRVTPGVHVTVEFGKPIIVHEWDTVLSLMTETRAQIERMLARHASRASPHG
ncbi:MAG: 1-acyl-sn-glycerol-3-phosphate acyltransferase [Candidatus Ryanbacteria bacterium]|nr:1-acyl-sn-glycerol-3-phosphate acyltransferase [Candidatus Ryanbacteria bacterium]